MFRITTSKNEYIYLTDAEALEEYKEKNKGKKFLVNRNKGLGEQDADELEECLLNPKTRNVAQITVSDIKKTDVLFTEASDALIEEIIEINKKEDLLFQTRYR